MKAIPVLYADIDSTVRHGWKELGRLVTTAQDVVVYPGALAKIKKASAEGWRIIGITNQERIASGEMTMAQLNENMLETVRQCGDLFDRIMICIHNPDVSDPEMAVCWCRKPRIGNVVEAARDLAEAHPEEYYPPHMALFVGNQDSDRQCAENAGIPFMWADEWRGDEASHDPSVELDLKDLEDVVAAGTQINLGKAGPITPLLRRLAHVRPELRRSLGERINALVSRARRL